MEKNLPKIAILFSGVGTNMAYILKHMHKKELEVAVVLTNNPAAKGIAIAKAHQIPLEILDSKTFSQREVFDRTVVETLENYTFDLTVLAGFMRILTPVFTDTIRAINLHPSLLPRHKGTQAIEKSYADPNREGGVSIHWVTGELDGGEVILQHSVDKTGLSWEAYRDEIRHVEKVALAEGIRKVLKIK